MMNIDELYHALGMAYFKYGELSSELELTQEAIQDLLKQIKNTKHEGTNNNLHRGEKPADLFRKPNGD